MDQDSRRGIHTQCICTLYMYTTLSCEIHVPPYNLHFHVPVDVQAIGKHSASRQFLETKVEELEKVRKASNQEMDEKSVLSTCV